MLFLQSSCINSRAGPAQQVFVSAHGLEIHIKYAVPQFMGEKQNTTIGCILRWRKKMWNTLEGLSKATIAEQSLMPLTNAERERVTGLLCSCLFVVCLTAASIISLESIHFILSPSIPSPHQREGSSFSLWSIHLFRFGEDYLAPCASALYNKETPL